MRREFVETSVFRRSWEEAGLDDEVLKTLENILLADPQAGDVIPHLNGGRKLRLSVKGQGKSGGARVIYVDVVVCERIYLLLAYPQNVQTDLTPEQKKELRVLIKLLKEE